VDLRLTLPGAFERQASTPVTSSAWPTVAVKGVVRLVVFRRSRC
jgi:hypothetical protein